MVGSFLFNEQIQRDTSMLFRSLVVLQQVGAECNVMMKSGYVEEFFIPFKNRLRFLEQLDRFIQFSLFVEIATEHFVFAGNFRGLVGVVFGVELGGRCQRDRRCAGGCRPRPSSDQLQAPRLGVVPPALLGLPDPDDPLRQLRGRAGA